MIAFDLKCTHGHVFEAWFRTSGDYESQRAGGLLACPVCDDGAITKAIMAPNVGRKANQRTRAARAGGDGAAVPAAAISAPAKTGTAMQAQAKVPDRALPADVVEKWAQFASEMREVIEKTCDNVGKQFAEEARKIHYGEADDRPIYGEATLDQAQELHEEGIDIMPLPFRRTDA